MSLSRHRLSAMAGLVMIGVFALAACGGSSAGETSAVPEPTATTTTVVPQAQVAPRTSPPPKVTTTVTTTTTTPRPAGFPNYLALPVGEVGYYTGSPVTGFHLNISTEERFSDLVRFFTTAAEETNSWSISVRDVGRGFLPGYEEQWAIYTADDHVLTQVSGAYEGVIEIEGRHVNILLDPIEQPPVGEVPPILPGEGELLFPAGEIKGAEYAAGLVRMIYITAPGEFEGLVEMYRERGWDELGANASIAVGELDGWKVTIELFPEEAVPPDTALRLIFENLALSYP